MGVVSFLCLEISMRVKKILNNNVVLVSRNKGDDCIVKQNGLGFRTKIGDEISEEIDQQVFVLSDELYEKYEKLVRKIDDRAVEIAESIIFYAKKKYGFLLNEMIHFTLADHIDGVIDRVSKGIVLKNELSLEISRIYRQEYEVGEYAVKCLRTVLDVNLLGDEAAFVAMHILNSRLNLKASEEQIQTTLYFISDIVKVVEAYFGHSFDVTSFSYYRFVMHLKGLVKRIYAKKPFEEDELLYDTLSKSYPEAALCAEKVAKMIFLKYSVGVSSEEKAFLTLYIEKLHRE